MIRDAHYARLSELHNTINEAVERLGRSIAGDIRSLEARLSSLERANAERL
jgi:uncharacterized protein YdcH (DUF465 family)